jgi:hypothetical protein
MDEPGVVAVSCGVPRKSADNTAARDVIHKFHNDSFRPFLFMFICPARPSRELIERSPLLLSAHIAPCLPSTAARQECPFS